MHTTRSLGRDDAFLAKQLRAGDAGGAGRFAAEAVRADLSFGVEHLLVGDFADDAVAAFERSQALVQIHGPIDFDRAGDRRGAAVGVVELGVVVVDDAGVRPAVVPAQAAAFVQVRRACSRRRR